MLISVTDRKMVSGVEAPGTMKGDPPRAHTYDWRTTGPGNTRGVRAYFGVCDLHDALSATYGTDAHLVTYVLTRDGEPVDPHPRINKSALSWLDGEGFEVSAGVLMADVDNPGHAAWTPDMLSGFRSRWLTDPAPGAGVYLTAHGYRLVQPLDEPVSVAIVERYIAAWHAELRSAGIEPDSHCRDWTRLYRLPNVLRAGQPYVSPYIDLSRMRPRVIHPIDPPKGEAVA